MNRPRRYWYHSDPVIRRRRIGQTVWLWFYVIAMCALATWMLCIACRTGTGGGWLGVAVDLFCAWTGTREIRSNMREWPRFTE